MSEAPDLRRHLVDDVLRWWLHHGPDDEYGGVFTCWENRGERRVSTDKYTWSQGRWIWLTARLAQALRAGTLPAGQDGRGGQDGLVADRGPDADRLLDLARSTADFVRTHALLGDGTTAYVTDRSGVAFEPVPGKGLHTSVFADCFVALGFAALASATGDEDAAAVAERLLHSADERILAGRPRTDPYPVHPDFQAFALPMILVGTGAEVHRATGSDRSAEITARAAAAIAGTFRRGADIAELQPRADGLDGTLLARHRTPGHVLECLWFLVHAANTVPGVAAALADCDARSAGADTGSARADTGPGWIPTVARHALDLGWDERHGGLFRYVDRDGGEPRGRLLDDPYEQLVRETWDTKLWWPHAEALYTTALLASRYPQDAAAGGASLADWHERLLAYTFATFPEGPGREWTQVRTRTGRPLERTVALPVKDPFHIARAMLLLVELDEMSTAKTERIHL